MLVRAPSSLVWIEKHVNAVKSKCHVAVHTTGCLWEQLQDTGDSCPKYLPDAIQTTYPLDELNVLDLEII